jgi:hypothetical protein
MREHGTQFLHGLVGWHSAGCKPVAVAIAHRSFKLVVLTQQEKKGILQNFFSGRRGNIELVLGSFSIRVLE